MTTVFGFIVAVLDTNSDPDDADYGIPGNDDALRSIKLLASRMADAVLDGPFGKYINDADPKAFEDKLREAGFYAEWKKTYGDEAWAILEAAIGRTLA